MPVCRNSSSEDACELPQVCNTDQFSCLSQTRFFQPSINGSVSNLFIQKHFPKKIYVSAPFSMAASGLSVQLYQCNRQSCDSTPYSTGQGGCGGVKISYFLLYSQGPSTCQNLRSSVTTAQWSQASSTLARQAAWYTISPLQFSQGRSRGTQQASTVLYPSNKSALNGNLTGRKMIAIALVAPVVVASAWRNATI